VSFAGCSPRRSGADTKRRSVAKAISWRAVGTFDTFLLSWLITGKARFAVAISLVEVVTKMTLYFFHERLWNRIKYGREEPDYNI
jgi:uncharacterized membrane protein